MNKSIFYIDPMSYNNLALYDVALLNNEKSNFKIYYICNEKFSENIFGEVIVKKIFNYSDKNSLLKFLSYFISLIRIGLLIYRYSPKIIHIQWFKIPIIEYLFYSVLKLFRKELILIHTAHNILPHTHGKLDYLIYKLIYRFIDALIVHTEVSQIELIEIIGIKYQTKISIIPHGLLDYKFTDSQILEKITEIKIKSTNKTILAVLGNQSYYKGIDLLSEIWLTTEELKDNRNLLLLIAGSGHIPNFDELQLIENVFIDNNFIDDITFISYMKMADIILLPYRKISQSGVLLTALTLRKPFLVSQLGGLMEPLKFGKIGWSVIPGDLESLRAKILYLSNNLDEVKAAKTNFAVWEQIEIYYDWERIRQKTFCLYEKLSKC